MTFQLDSMTKVRVLDVRVLAAKDRKADDPPGAQLLLQATLPIGVLAMFDGFLPGTLYRKATGAAKQGALEGMEGAELTSIGEHVKRMKWDYQQTGCTIEIDHGTGGKRNLLLEDCKVHRVSISPQKGGSVIVQWTADAPALADATWAKLPGLKATDIQMMQSGPEVADDDQRDLDDDDDDKPAAPRKPGAPERAAVAKAGGDAGPKAPHKDDAAIPVNGGPTLHPATAWPFPGGGKADIEKPPQSATTEVVIERSQPGTRTARGRDKTKAALAAGKH